MVNSARPRILFVAEAVTLAHLARPLALAGSLDVDQYEIHFAAEPRYQGLYPDNSYSWHRIESISSEQFLAALEKGNPLYDARTLSAYVDEDVRLLEEVRPDLVVGDFRLSLGVSAALAGIPYLTISNAYWSPFARQSIPVPELPLTRIAGVRLSQLLFNLVRPLVFAVHTIPFNRVRRKYGLPLLSLKLQEIYTHADHVLYADLPGLIALPGLPDNHHFLGPILWTPPVGLPEWWGELTADRPVIYVTLGSSGRADLLQVVLDALANLHIQAIVATAGRVQLDSIPANAHVTEYLPGIEAAGRAALVICNGGSPTTQQALVNGVPVLGIVSNLDQHLNMNALQQAGAGRLLRSEYTSRDAVADMVSEMLAADNYKKAAQQLASQAKDHVAEKEFPLLLERILAAD